MAPDFLQLGAKWPLESKFYFEACYLTLWLLHTSIYSVNGDVTVYLTLWLLHVPVSIQ